MAQQFWLGMAVFIVAGLSNASFALPMKYSRQWKWENTWFVFTTLALLVLPIILAIVLVPNLWQTYATVPFTAFLPGAIFGFLWGLAQATFGLAIARVGVAMAFSIVVGMSGVMGSLIPMAVLHRGDFLGPRGIILMVSTAILVVGLSLYGKAARLREIDSGAVPSAKGSDYRVGMALCLFTGALGGMINLGFAFSKTLQARAEELGASPNAATFAVWVIVLGAGYIPSLVYTVYLMGKNGTAGAFAKSFGREGWLALAMAILWLFGSQGYGVGATIMGSYGTSIGYAIYISMLILGSTICGVLTGEWKQAQPSTRRRMHHSVAIILASLLFLSTNGLF